MGAGAGRPASPSAVNGEIQLHRSVTSETDSKYLADRSQKRWSSKGDGVLWGKLSSLDKDEIGDIYLQGNVFSIGRDGVLCTYQIVNKLVSSYHVELKVEQYGKSVRVIFVHDHSTNGTFLDGQRVGAGNKTVLSEGSKLSLPWFSNGVEKVVSFRYEPIKVVSDDWEPILSKYTFGTITFEGTFTTYQLITPKQPAGGSGTKGKDPEILTCKIIDMDQMQHAFSSKSAEAMVKKEVNLLGKLVHKNIAPLRDSFMGREYSFLVFKYPTLSPHRAYDLSELLQMQWDASRQILRAKHEGATRTPEGQPIPSLVSESLVRHLMKQLVEVVAYIHSQDISHRNISPENCLLDYDQEAGNVSLKLSNFGFASSFADNVAMQTKIETGHIDFCAPEMILSEHGYGKEVDLWSVGVLAMMLLGGGRAPFRKESLAGPGLLRGWSSAGSVDGNSHGMDPNNKVGANPSDAGGAGGGGGSGSGAGPSSDESPMKGPEGRARKPVAASAAGDESGLSTASVIENITQAKFDFMPEELWKAGNRSETCKVFIQSLLVADPTKRASAEDLLNGNGSKWLNE